MGFDGSFTKNGVDRKKLASQSKSLDEVFEITKEKQKMLQYS